MAIWFATANTFFGACASERAQGREREESEKGGRERARERESD